VLKICVIHGPNLNLLGEREPQVYGAMTLNDLNDAVSNAADELGIQVTFYQSNHEGEIIDFLHDSRNKVDGIVINPAAFTHYSYALRDALAAIELPTVEVHLSDIYNREKFRRHSVTREVCLAQFSGKGLDSYLDGLSYLIKSIRNNNKG